MIHHLIAVSSSMDLQDKIFDFKDLFLNHFNEWLNNQLLNNDFLIASVVAILTSVGLYLLRNVPAAIWNFLTHRFSLTVSIFSNNPSFVDVAFELDRKTIQMFSRGKILDDNKITIGLGTSYAWFMGWLVKVHREKEKTDSREFKQTLTLSFPFVSNKKLTKLFNDFSAMKRAEKNQKIRIYEGNEGYLSYLKEIDKRKRESIFIPMETLEYIESRIKYFLENRQWYVDHGIPYKYAIILYGVPGTGKTTIAKYIASFTNRKLIIVHPSKLKSLTASISHNSIDEDGEATSHQAFVGLMEDIDCDEITKKRPKGKRKTILVNKEDDDAPTTPGSSFTKVFMNLSDLLNSIDGLNAPENFILVATTNDLESLDPALLRKGRFDDTIEIKPLETVDIVRMIKHFRTDGDKIINREFKALPGAIVQDYILQTIDKPLEELYKLLDSGQKI
jgi:chaperone BCS1